MTADLDDDYFDDSSLLRFGLFALTIISFLGGLIAGWWVGEEMAVRNCILNDDCSGSSAVRFVAVLAGGGIGALYGTIPYALGVLLARTD